MKNITLSVESERFAISSWDAAILAAPEALGAGTLPDGPGKQVSSVPINIY